MPRSGPKHASGLVRRAAHRCAEAVGVVVHDAAGQKHSGQQGSLERGRGRERGTHVLPHQTWTLSSPIEPFFGYWRMKKMSTALTATPESSAADRT